MWGYNASIGGYVSALFLNRGVPSSIIGYMLSAASICMMAGVLFWSRLIDRHRANRRYLRYGQIVVFVLGLLMYLFSYHTLAAAVLFCAFDFFDGVMGTTMDSWVIALYPENPNMGAKSRTFGTVGYAFSMLITGQLINTYGFRMMPILCAIQAVGTVVTTMMLPEVPEKAEGVSQKNANGSKAANGSQAANGSKAAKGSKAAIGYQDTKAKVSALGLLQIPSYVLLVLAVFCFGSGLSPILNMKAMIFEEIGAGVDYIGWDSFIGCMLQIPFLLFIGYLSRIPGTTRLLMAGVLAVMDAVCIMIAKSPALVITGTVCYSISFALAYAAMREIVEHTVQPELRNTAHGITDVAQGAMSHIIATAWGGTVMQNQGKAMLSRICLIFDAAAILLFFVLSVYRRRIRNSL